MRFQSVALAADGYHLPDEVLRSEALEARMASLYQRLGLHPGRLELMSGIRERRVYSPGTLPSAIATLAAEHALQHSDFPRERIGMLIHSAVCRDFLEPATASVVHAHLGLAPECELFDLSNACLGFANALMLIASRIEHGEIEAGLVVSGENGGPLLDATVQALSKLERGGRAELKRAYASLTIGAGGAAMLLTHVRHAPTAPRWRGGLCLAASEYHRLCQGDQSKSDAGPLMETDSEALLVAGNALAQRTWPRFLEHLGWSGESVRQIITHQVGSAHKRLLFQSLGLDPALDFPTVEFLGNIGSVSLPISYSLARERGFFQAGSRSALLGIGSGLNCAMLGLESPA